MLPKHRAGDDVAGVVGVVAELLAQARARGARARYRWRYPTPDPLEELLGDEHAAGILGEV